MKPEDITAIRAALTALPRADNHKPGQPVDPDDVYLVRSHQQVLDWDRPVIMGNRGMGKSFWAHALTNPVIRARLARQIPVLWLAKAEVVIGFNASERTDQIAPALPVLNDAVKGGSVELPWKAILARVASTVTKTPLPSPFSDLVSWVSKDAERYAQLLTAADNELCAMDKRLLVVFDGLDRLDADWRILQAKVQGLLKVALAAQSFRALRVKLFLRRDQALDRPLFAFPDGSKLQNSVVSLSWTPNSLYELLFQKLRSCPAFRALEEATAAGDQAALVQALTGPYMGKHIRRGVVHTWLPAHLADALHELSPRTFLTAWREAAAHHPCAVTTPIDHHGINEGMRKASEDRLAELSQDYPWVKAALEPLRGQSVPLARTELTELWRKAGTFDQVVRHAVEQHRAIYVSVAHNPAGIQISDEERVLGALKHIGVVEERASGRVDVPDIFRVEAGIKRAGGVKLPRRTKPE